MENLLDTMISEEDRYEFKEFISFVVESETEPILRNDIIQRFRDYCDTYERPASFREKSSIFVFFKKAQELFAVDDHLHLMHRYAAARYRFFLIRKDGEYIEETSLFHYLDMRDYAVLQVKNEGLKLRLDFMPFYDFSPTIRDVQTVGSGIRFLNRYMSSNIFSHPQKWLNKSFTFIKMHQYNGQQLLVNGSILSDPMVFFDEFEKVLEWLENESSETPYSDVKIHMKKSGFEVGWGNTVGRIRETMQTLLALIGEPTDELLEKFISRVPMPLISKIAIISPHGWFGQTNALGKPDTGGQVIYILDQVRALETHLKKELN
jgi:sucrose synthase